MLPFVLLSAAIWGVVVACFIEWTRLGRWIAERMTWFIVAVGTGGDFLIMLLLVDDNYQIAWWQMVAVVAVSSVAVAVRGIHEFYAYYMGIMGDANQDAPS